MDEKVSKKILIVDDEMTVRRLVKRLLSKEYAVIEAENGVEAIDIAKSQKPDLILMDMMMPKMDGLSACYEIKQDVSTRQIPVVMLTAITHDLNKRLSENVMGANGYITKPFNAVELISTIRELLNSDRITEPLSG
jgi:two-component system, OmpR family, alkaline phosphatase synthesis response regulator PhoP